jgi:MFS superfamily sulfate permease-like transporter
MIAKMNTPAADIPSMTWAQTFAKDFMASLVVFLVALPLCMGVAIASGAPSEKAAVVGIVTGVIGGIVVGALSGCSLQASGPAAGLVVLVGQIIEEQSFERLGVIILVAGVIQIAFGAMRLGKWFRAVSPAVIQGMLAGIGVLIFASQFHMMLDAKPPGAGKDYGGLINVSKIPEAMYVELQKPGGRLALLIGAATILTIILWSNFAPKRVKLFPAPLAGAIVGTILANLLYADVKYITFEGRIVDALHLPSFHFPAHEWSNILFSGAAVALVASAESLLTATAVDTMQQHAPRTNYDREMIAQGVGNSICGLCGALPITGVIVRSSANVQAGARTRASTIMHGFWLLAAVTLAPQLLKLIPVSSLAGVLVYTGYKLVNLKPVKKYAEYGKGLVLVYIATLTTIVCVDLLAGIAVGMALVVAKILYSFSNLEIQYEEGVANGKTILRLNGAATFLCLPRLAEALRRVSPTAKLHIDFKGLNYIDHACLELIMNWENQHRAQGGLLFIDWNSLTFRFKKPGAPPSPQDGFYSAAAVYETQAANCETKG